MKPFPWRAGMRCYNRDFDTPCRIVAILDGEALAVHENTDCPLGFTDDLSNFSGADLEDAATLGALEAKVCAHYGDRAHLIPFLTSDETGIVRWWALADERGALIGITSAEGHLRYLAGPTTGTALLAAWEAAP